MATLVTRSGKGSPLTHAEVDANFTNLNTDKLELSGGTMTGNLSFGNSVKATFGASADLQIYHDGTYSRIYDSSVNLVIGGEYVVLQKADGTDNYFRAAPNAEVKIYYDGSEKLATTSTGVDITGTLTSDGLTVDGSIVLNNASAQNISFTNTAVNPTISSVRALNIDIDSDGNQGTTAINFTHDNGAGTIASFNETGDISFYEDTGTTAKFFWDASAENLGIGKTAPTASLHTRKSTGSDGLRIETSNTNNGFIHFADPEDDNAGRLVYSHSDNSMSIHTSGSERMRIDSSGNVGIGISSPAISSRLNVSSTTQALDSGGTIFASVTDAIAADIGGQVMMGGYYTGTSTAAFGGLAAKKSNATDGNYDAYLQFLVSTNGLGNTEKMRIDSSGNVGIGTTSPSAPLHVLSTSIPQANFAYDADRYVALTHSSIFNVSGAGQTNNLQIASRGQGGLNEITFFTGGTDASGTGENERMRIDSSGNLLVGKTGTTNLLTTAGHVFYGNGEAFLTRAGTPLFLGRTGSDGSIVNFYKDGTAVGSIGTNSSRPYIGSSLASTDANIKFTDVQILPCDATGANTDGTDDIGSSSARFKDLYLSGTIEIENGTGNVGVGKDALNSNTANNNTAVGYQAGYSNTTGIQNLFVGTDAGYANTTGSGNTYVGRGDSVAAGVLMTTGSKNTILGGFTGNQGGLDIRTSSNNIVLSDGDGNPELWLDSGGSLKLGGFVKNSAGTSDLGHVFNPAGTSTHRFTVTNNQFLVYDNYNGAGVANMDFRWNNSASGAISVGSSSVSYLTTSDYRLKENVVDLTGATDRLKQLEPKRFNFIVDADTTVDGFLAHEVQSVVPEAVTGEKDATNDDGTIKAQGIDQSKLVPLLVATIKELEARITALENA